VISIGSNLLNDYYSYEYKIGMRNICKISNLLLFILLLCGTVMIASPVFADANTVTVTDDLNRTVTVPSPPSAVVSTGMATRFNSYLGALGSVVGVSANDASTSETLSGASYKLANPQLKSLPVVCEVASVNLNEEKIVSLNPDLVYKSDISDAKEADELSDKIHTPVVTILKGGLGTEQDRQDLYRNLRMLGEINGKSEQAEDLISYIKDTIADLNSRSAGIDNSSKPSVYIGGIAYKGSHGLDSTSGTDPGLTFVNANNVAKGMPASGSVSKEQIIQWNPDVIFVDLATLGNAKTGKTAIDELKTEPAYKNLKAVKDGKVYATLPNVWSYANLETPLANAYYIGSVLYPDKFSDIDPKKKADEIYTKFLGKPLFSELNKQYENLAYSKLDV
jgi:iron complex transport system substrate-binding protein